MTFDFKQERRDAMTADFKTEVHDKQDDIDPGSDYYWYEITLGWAIAKGLTPNDAHAFANHIRYYTELG